MQITNKEKLFSTAAFIFTIILFIIIAALYFYNIIQWGANYPNFGFGFRTATGVEIVGVVWEHGENAGIKIGDRIVDVNGKKYKTLAELRTIVNWELGADNLWHIERKGKDSWITIKNIPSGFKRSFSVSGFPFLLGVCYTLIGVIVFLMRPHHRSSWLFFLFTASLALLLFFLFTRGTVKPIWLLNFKLIAYCFTPAFMINLALGFPEERKILKTHPSVQYIPLTLSTLLFIAIRYSTSEIVSASPLWQLVAVLYMAFAVMFFIISCVTLWLKSESEIVKLRSKAILLGFALTSVMPALDFAINAAFKIYILPSFSYYLPFFIFLPAFVGYSIVKHDLFDIDAIIKRTYGYVLTTGAIAGLYGIFVLISNLTFGSFDFAKTPVFPLIFLLAIVFLFNPIRNRVQKFIDRVFYRLEYDYQETVQKISESMRTLLGLDEIGQSIMATAMGTMFIDSGFVMLRRKKDDLYRCLIRSGKKDMAFAAKETEEPGADDGAEKIEATDAPMTAVEEEGENSQILKNRAPSDEIVLASEEPFIKLLSEYQKEVTIYDIQENPFFEDRRASCMQIFDQMDATLVVPLIHEKNLIGMMSLGRKKSGKFYRQDDINLLNILANQGAVAIENALMLEEVIEKERMEEELTIAKDLQISMLPAECPQMKGFEIAAFSESAREVGGDFYDFIEISKDKLGIVIGDVTGKSVSGALVMSASRSIFRMLGEDRLSVSESMMRANRRTKKDIKAGMFVALMYVVLGSEDKSLTLCSAGQTQPVFRPAASGETFLVETEGDSFPLGILEEACYEETRLKLENGDRVVLYTDGVVEAMNDQGELFGFDRLLEVIKHSTSGKAELLLEEIRQKVNQFAGDAPQHDDITIIVIQAI